MNADDTILLPVPLLYGLYLPVDPEGGVLDQFEPRLVVIHAQRRTGAIVTLLHDGPEAAPLVLCDGSGDKSRLGASVQPTFAGVPVFPSLASAGVRLAEMHKNMRRAKARLAGATAPLLEHTPADDPATWTDRDDEAERAAYRARFIA